jgi:hypothetical protein
MLSEIITARDGLKENSSIAGDTESVAGIGEFVAELKEMVQAQYQKQRGNQVRNWKCSGSPAGMAHFIIILMR